MERVLEILNLPIITTADQTIVLWQVVFLPMAIFAAYWLSVRMIRFIASRLLARGVNPDAVHLLRRAIYVLAISILAFTTLDILNVPLTAFAFISGAIAIGVGFGAQNIINNFISGWILMWERPVRIGDFLEIDDVKGTVESINTRSTRIRRTDGVHLLLPNSQLLENTVVNWTLVDRLARTEVRVGVAYGSDVRRVEVILGQAVTEQESVLRTPRPAVYFADFGDNALAFDVVFWVNATTEKDLRAIRSDLRFRISELLTENGIVIAFPQRDVHLDGSIRIEKVGVTAGATGSKPLFDPEPG
jgi:small-conductance mechanosensitive channel